MNAGNPEGGGTVSLLSRRKRLIEIGAEVVTHDRYVTFHVAEAAVPRQISMESRAHCPFARADGPVLRRTLARKTKSY